MRRLTHSTVVAAVSLSAMLVALLVGGTAFAFCPHMAAISPGCCASAQAELEPALEELLPASQEVWIEGHGFWGLEGKKDLERYPSRRGPATRRSCEAGARERNTRVDSTGDGR